MTALERLIPTPYRIEIDRVDLCAPPARVWEAVRHGDLGRGAFVRALFALRTLPSRLAGSLTSAPILSLDQLASTTERPGFGVLWEDEPHEVAVGAIGKVWLSDIPFVHVSEVDAFAAFDDPGYAKVAWAIRLTALPTESGGGTHLELEVRVDATDAQALQSFRRYFRVIGPASRLIRRLLLADLARELGSPEPNNEQKRMAGDELMTDAKAQLTHTVDIAAQPDAIWPWLVQLGCGRAGYYSYDILDNGNHRSARELHPDLHELQVGEVLPATPEGGDGFEVLAIDAPRALVFGSLRDASEEKQLPFASSRPSRFTQMTWAFEIEALDERSSRLYARVRATGSVPLHLAWIRPLHHFMESAQLEGIKARAEGSLATDDWRDVLEGIGGAVVIALAFATSFLRGARSHWGVDEETAARLHPGDELVPDPAWSWTHGVEIEAPAESVWPWVAQIGADRAGFYSYQWLENLAGCQVRNAERVHPEWEARRGDKLSIHPEAPPLDIVEVEPGRYLVAYGAPDEAARAAGEPWVAVTWVFEVERLGEARCRFISRYRCALSKDLKTRLAFGAGAVEPIGFAMDRRMLLGLKARAEAKTKRPPQLR